MWREAAAVGVLGVVLAGCGSNLKMQLGTPLELKRGYGFDDTRFAQNARQVDRGDVKSKLGNRDESTDSIGRGKVYETLATVARVPGFLLLIFGLAPKQQIDLSTGTRIGLLSGAGVCLAGSLGFSLAAESNYADAVEQYNARIGAAPASSQRESQSPSDVVGRAGRGARMTGDHPAPNADF
ncbi:MAG: hypothetical protein QM756_38465 [Polyangiaceae bacterium]